MRNTATKEKEKKRKASHGYSMFLICYLRQPEMFECGSLGLQKPSCSLHRSLLQTEKSSTPSLVCYSGCLSKFHLNTFHKHPYYVYNLIPEVAVRKKFINTHPWKLICKNQILFWRFKQL